MKVIDLLKQIALKNIPKRIKYNDYEWEYDGENYRIQASSGTYINWDYVVMNCLNEEVEIIEEPQEHKIPEKLESYISCGWAGTCKDLKREDLFNDLKKIGSKINEILDYLEEIE